MNYLVNLSTGYVSKDRADPALGASPKVVLMTKNNSINPMVMTVPQLIAQANMVRSIYIRMQSRELVIGAVPDAERILLLEMQHDLEERKIATPGDAGVIDPILTAIKSWQDWVVQVMQDFIEKLNTVRGRASLLDAYEVATIDIPALTAARPADNIEQVIRDYGAYLTS